MARAWRWDAIKNILEVRDLNAGYGKAQVLFEVSLKVEEGTICTILGPNGSGKSTLLKTIFGLTKVYSGSIKFKGVEVVGMEPYEIARMGLSYLPQVENIYQNLSVRENLIMAGYTLSKEDMEKRIEEVLETFPILKDFLDRKAMTLSGGERQMLVMARSLMRRPSLMLFDEPSANLSPKLSEMIFEKIKELNGMGITIVFVEQNTRKALEISDEAYLLVSGRVRFHGKAKELANNKEFGRLFLGL